MFILRQKGDQGNTKKRSLTFYTRKFTNSINLELISEHTWKTRQSGTTHRDLPVANHATSLNDCHDATWDQGPGL